MKKLTGSIFGLLLAVFLTPAVQAQVIYDSTTTPLPGNLPSVGAQAYAFNEIGDAVTFTGTARSPKTATVTMSSWGCESGAWFSGNCFTNPGATFSIPITLNIYAAGSPLPGTLIASTTQTFNIPYRPSTDANCTGGRWYDSGSDTCFNGLAHNITFDLSSLNVLLPNSAVFGIVYDTTTYGPNPIGTGAACFSTPAGCPYDSLNVALSSSVTTGSKPYPQTLYWNNFYASNYCDNGLAGTGSFRLDSPTSACWYDTAPGVDDYIPSLKVTAYTIATNAAGCKNGGWQSLSRAGGSSFKNQGDCIQYVNATK